MTRPVSFSAPPVAQQIEQGASNAKATGANPVRGTITRGNIALLERFYSHVGIGPHCWEWQAGRSSVWGYGSARVAGRTVPAHRLSWQLTYGDIPAGMVVCHACDNPPCVRPSHLFLGTQRDNIQDSLAKGRHSSLHQRKPIKTELWHGTYSGYNTHRCRCADCRAANAEKMRQEYRKPDSKYRAGALARGRKAKAA